MVSKCECGGQERTIYKDITFKDRTVKAKFLKCQKCGDSVISADEAERVQKQLHKNSIMKLFGTLKFKKTSQQMKDEDRK